MTVTVGVEVEIGDDAGEVVRIMWPVGRDCLRDTYPVVADRISRRLENCIVAWL